VDIVTADGRFLTASSRQNSDLFWGVRGGGGNFGVVTSFEFQVHPVGTVLGGLVIHPVTSAGDVLRLRRENVDTVPDELTWGILLFMVPPVPFLPEKMHGVPASTVSCPWDVVALRPDMPYLPGSFVSNRRCASLMSIQLCERQMFKAGTGGFRFIFQAVVEYNTLPDINIT
jgi:hypothetical protein